MFKADKTIPCPVCAELGKESKIPFETSQLLAGVKFTCPECKSEIGLAPESRPAVQEAVDKFEEFKRKNLSL